MIIWSGFGFLVPLCLFIVSILTTKIGLPLSENKNVNEAIVLYIAAIIVWIMSYFLAKDAKKKSNILIEPNTQQKVLIIRRDSLFFIPIKYWPIILAAIATSLFFLSEQ